MPITMHSKTILYATTLMFAFAMAPSPATAQDAAKGAQLYTSQKCIGCHSISGKGNKNNPLDGVGAKLSANDIREWLVHPTEMAAKTKSTKKPPMQDRYSKLPAADIDALVAYMQSLK
jgi:mono/diheme cytochrome c family protein